MHIKWDAVNDLETTTYEVVVNDPVVRAGTLRVAHVPLDSSVGEILLETEADTLSSSYRLVNPGSIRTFLCDHAELVKILKDGVDYIRFYFPENTLRLVHIVDVEEPGEEHLAIRVECSENIERDIETLNLFRRHWWSSVLPKIDGTLTICLNG